MNRILESYKALKEAEGFKASLARVGVAALVGIGGITLFFGWIGGVVWLVSLPKNHPIAQVISVVALPTFVLSVIGAVTFLAHLFLFSLPERVARKDNEC